MTDLQTVGTVVADPGITILDPDSGDSHNCFMDCGQYDG